MDPNLLKGNLDLILLATLEESEKYGLEITKEVVTRTEGYFSFKEGTLYPALHRLEKHGLIRGEFKYLPRGGSPVKFYQLTPFGLAELRTRRHEYTRFSLAMNAILGGAA